MAMPNDLVLVRHGQSEGNVATDAAKAGDSSHYTDAFITTPGHQWRLTAKGRAQAAAIGSWLVEEFPGGFDHHYASPYVRARETAGCLGLPGASWLLSRALRERDWGDVGTVPYDDFHSDPRWRENARMKHNDPLYWVPPGGESIAQVVEDRVRNVLSTLHREADGQQVVAVAHGELLWAFRIMLERWDDDEFVRRDADKTQRIRNCQALHYTRIDPATGKQAPRLTWVRRATPVEGPDGTWDVEQTGWERFDRPALTNDELLASVAEVPYLFAQS